METTAELAAIQLKINQEMRRNQQRDKTLERLKHRYHFDASLLSSSESGSDIDDINRISEANSEMNDNSMSNSDDNDDSAPIVTIRRVKKQKSKIRRTKSKSGKLTRQSTSKLKHKRSRILTKSKSTKVHVDSNTNNDHNYTEDENVGGNGRNNDGRDTTRVHNTIISTKGHHGQQKASKLSKRNKTKSDRSLGKKKSSTQS